MTAKKLPWRTLDRPLTVRERAGLRQALGAMLRWQRDLHDWRPCRSAPNAMPFVALYARGRLFGCFGSHEGSPGERLSRAFLLALSDPRFGGVFAADRRGMVAEVSYLRNVRMCSREHLLTELELGTHGVGLLRDGRAPVILLPSVARDGGLTVPQVLVVLLRKAGCVDNDDPQFFLFETESVTCRMGVPSLGHVSPPDAAAAWLSRLITHDGAVTFAADARSGTRQFVGAMHHGRAAVVLQALAQHGEYRRHVSRGRKRLERDLRAALAGRPPPGWPEHPSQVAGTLALAVMAGVRLRTELVEYAGCSPDLARTPWHAAQVATALGGDAPLALWRACVDDLEREPWSPWTALAARARGDATTLARVERALVESIRTSAPYVGGVLKGARAGIPATALTAVTVEALAGSRGAAARAAVVRARNFLARRQITEQGPASSDTSSWGAFQISPVGTLLRCDVTAHALVALGVPEGSTRVSATE